MGIAEVTHGFCAVCGTGHDPSLCCPGDLRATGPERPGWKIHVETPKGSQAIGVLLAPSFDQWRARIVTYPNVLWSAPGGRGALKFVGDTAAEAEAQAIRFVVEHVRAKRYVRRDAAADTPAQVSPRFSTATRRKERCLALRFGTERPLARGVTVNVSAEGMFVRAPELSEEGRSVLINIELNGQTLTLRGLVMWTRPSAQPSRPAGMGILLSNPPAVYQSYVASLP